MSEGRDAGAKARRSSTGLTRAHHHAGTGPFASLVPGSGAADVSSLDFFARDLCGSSLLTEVAKNSNAPRAPAVPFASSPDAAITRPHRTNQGHFTRPQRGVVRCRSTGVASERSPEGESENASSETRPRWPRRTPGGVALDHPERPLFHVKPGNLKRQRGCR